MSKGVKIALGIVLSFMVISIIFSSLSRKSLAKKIDSNPNFNYSTSLTSNYDRSDKAKVYSTKMSPAEAARYLISEDRPLEHTDLNNDDAIQLTYDDYYVLIYQNEDGETYIQISSRKYVHNNGYQGLYRPYRSNIITFYSASYLASRYYGRDINRYGQGYARPVKTSTNTSTTNTTDTKTNSSKINTDKNASSKIRTESSKTNSNTTTKSVRTGSAGTKSRVGGGTSFGK
ncbi:hypothetical protein HZI73_04995 [Vallitalea pronyensis]|uniref:DUF4247 domain-containing protein n=1 Tax=Vallitalea pronyensis TaxID=1348613 RepID=A0A8J8SFX3_9FIRM|nr:hypothetical protein [Vallitalea pronyensis]QUI21688.1 hypothetical protein HZI73_04995 [Vallitalea pronyensis]